MKLINRLQALLNLEGVARELKIGLVAIALTVTLVFIMFFLMRDDSISIGEGSLQNVRDASEAIKDDLNNIGPPNRNEIKDEVKESVDSNRDSDSPFIDRPSAGKPRISP